MTEKPKKCSDCRFYRKEKGKFGFKCTFANQYFKREKACFGFVKI